MGLSLVGSAERIAVFTGSDAAPLQLGRWVASRWSFCLDPDGYAFSRPEQSWDHEPNWLAKTDGSRGRFATLAEIWQPARRWALDHKLIVEMPGWEVSWPAGDATAQRYTFDDDEARALKAAHRGAELRPRQLAQPSDSFATRLEFDFGYPVSAPEIVLTAAAGLYLAQAHPDIDGILCDPGGRAGSNPFACGSLIMGTRHRWDETDPPAGDDNDNPLVAF